MEQALILAGRPFAAVAKAHIACRFDDDDGLLLASRTDADQGGALDLVVGVEDGFDAFGEESAVCSFDSMGLAAAVPEATGFIEIADVAHAMPSDFGFRIS